MKTIDLEHLKSDFEHYLDEQTRNLPDGPLKDAMRYSLLAKGKRIRPLLLFAALADYGLDPEEGFPFGAAIEMIHTYSLIHDDMPEMDNDDLRRGKPTCHKQYGTDMALLAGDGLQSLAFEQVCSIPDPQKAIDLAGLLAKYAGASGMCYGQQLDLRADPALTLENLEAIERYKTGCLLALPLAGAAILAGSKQDLARWDEIGKRIGIQFQIQDDLLERTSSVEVMGKSLSDCRNEKGTALSLFSLEEGQAKVLDYQKRIQELLEADGLDHDNLLVLVDLLTHRTY